RSEKTIVALREYLVYGYSKQESCDRNNVSNSYFCLCLKKLNYTHGIVSALKYFYQT
ncbi:TPA: transcriptional regulator, partial [Escherichia coli]|nr:transcriptional regulator [Escherichia coli]HBC1306907.1 transcriptional regulator [Escherichia coli]HCL7336794.1 transcriptional regulator [Escherichia coli]HDY2831832.1 transcriptional regulator [Escherichia coli]